MKIFSFFILNSILLLTTCVSPITNPNTTTSTEHTIQNSEKTNLVQKEIDSNPKTQTPYYISEIPSKRGASCFYFELQDSNKKTIDVSLDIQESLDCPFLLPILIPNSNKLIYLNKKNKLLNYDIESQKENTIMSFFPSTTGIYIGDWSPDSSKLLILTVNYTDTSYPELTKLFIINFDSDYNFIDKSKHSLKINFSCGSANCTPKSEDLKWISNTEIQYKTWQDYPYDLPNSENLRTLYIKE